MADFISGLIIAIKKWQKENKIKADGLCGPSTHRRIYTERYSAIDDFKPFNVKEKESIFESIGFNMIDEYEKLISQRPIDMVYNISENGESRRFKVYTDYKLKLKAYSKKRFDPFCRWDRIIIPYDEENNIQTTIGQLNFFKWVLENKILNIIFN